MKYYVCGHTAKGPVNFFANNVHDLQRIIVLKHPSATIKSTILNAVIHYFSTEKVEVLTGLWGKADLHGVIVRDLSFAIVIDDIVTNDIKNVTTVDLTQYMNKKYSTIPPRLILNQINQLHERAYEYFHEGLSLHEKLEKIYIKEMDFNKADQIADKFIAKLFNQVEIKKRTPVVYERLFGTNTAIGIVNHIENIISQVPFRVFIKGRAGTGKSVFMKRILNACLKNGYDVEVYHCSFDPKSIDMIIIRELNYCLFDSTAPHEFFPTRDTDEIIDLYELTVTPFTDEKYATEIEPLMTEYKQKMNAGLQMLARAKPLFHKLESIWELPNEQKLTNIVQKLVE